MRVVEAFIPRYCTISQKRQNPVHLGLDHIASDLLSASDLREDAAWRFAPVGVLAHIERDAINQAQLRAFGPRPRPCHRLLNRH